MKTSMWPHPDSAWSSNYFSPDYYDPNGRDETDPCWHTYNRERVGSTGRGRFWLTADTCGRCGRILRSTGDLDWLTYIWVRRINGDYKRGKASR